MGSKSTSKKRVRNKKKMKNNKIKVTITYKNERKPTKG